MMKKRTIVIVSVLIIVAMVATTVTCAIAYIY